MEWNLTFWFPSCVYYCTPNNPFCLELPSDDPPAKRRLISTSSDEGTIPLYGCVEWNLTFWFLSCMYYCTPNNPFCLELPSDDPLPKRRLISTSSDEGGNNSTLWVCGIKSNILIPILYVLLLSRTPFCRPRATAKPWHHLLVRSYLGQFNRSVPFRSGTVLCNRSGTRSHYKCYVLARNGNVGVCRVAW